MKVTSGHWQNKQNKRFHWGGTDIHVGVIIERRKDGDTVWVYFCNYKRDPRITAILTDNKDLLKMKLYDSELNLDDPKDPIYQSLGKVTADGTAALVGPASEHVAKYLQILKPMLGKLL